MKLKLNMSCHLMNVYTKIQIDISKHVEKARKTRRDGRTDGRADGRTNVATALYDGRIKTKLHGRFTTQKQEMKEC